MKRKAKQRHNGKEYASVKEKLKTAKYKKSKNSVSNNNNEANTPPRNLRSQNKAEQTNMSSDKLLVNKELQNKDTDAKRSNRNLFIYFAVYILIISLMGCCAFMSDPKPETQSENTLPTSQYDSLISYLSTFETYDFDINEIAEPTHYQFTTHSISAGSTLPTNVTETRRISIEYATTEPTETEEPTRPYTQPTQPKIKYIGNVNTHKFHYTWCSYLPYKRNQTYFYSRSAAIYYGYVPCKHCNP